MFLSFHFSPGKSTNKIKQFVIITECIRFLCLQGPAGAVGIAGAKGRVGTKVRSGCFDLLSFVQSCAKESRTSARVA